MAKKSISIFISLIVLIYSINIVCYAQAAQAVLNIDEYNLLKNLDIITDNINKQEVSRAEFAHYIVKLMNLSDFELHTSLFEDVDEFTDYSSDINMLASLGIFKGAGGRFFPDNLIKANEAITVAARVLGYDSISKTDGDLLKYAVQNKITDGVASEGPADINNISRLFFNVLNAKPYILHIDGKKTMRKSDELYMETVFNLYKDKGIVTSNKYTSLEGESGIGENEAEIGSKVYDTFVFDVCDKIGQKVVFYYQVIKNENDKLIYAYKSNDTEHITIQATDIDEFTQKRELKYRENGKIRTVNIPGTVDVIYNNKAYPNYSHSLFTPKSGKVELNKIGNQVTSVIISDYINCIVSSIGIDKSTKSIKISTEYPEMIIDLSEYDEKNIIITDVNGVKIDTASISADDVISVAISENSEIIQIIDSKETVTGTLEQISIDDDLKHYIINSKEYTVAKDSVKYLDARVNVGETGVFLLNTNEEIIFVNKVKDKAWNYGYVIKSDLKKFPKSTGMVRLLTENNEINIYECSNGFTVNKEKTTSENIERALNSISGKLVAYKLNSDDKIKWIEYTDAYEDDIAVSMNAEGLHFTYSTLGAKERFKASSQTFNGRGLMNSSTKVFFVKTDSSHIDEDNFYCKNTGALINDQFYIADLYTTDNTSQVAEAALIKDFSGEKLNSDSTIGLVSKITKTKNSDDVFVDNIRIVTSNSEICYDLDEKISVDDINGMKIVAGCVVRYAVNPKGVITDIALELDPYKDFDTALNYSSNPTADFTAKTRLLYGSVYSKTADTVSVYTGDISKLAAGDVVKISQLENYQNMKTMPIYVVNTDKKEVVTGSINDIRDYVSSGSDASKVLIRTYYGDIRNIFVFN